MGLRVLRSTQGLRPRAGIAPVPVRLLVAVLCLLAPALAHAQATTTRVSVGPGGAEGDNNSFEPVISADGRWVAFYSPATTLVAGDTNGKRDVFVFDRQTGATTRVSVAPGGVEGNNHSWSPAISADGRWVAFNSDASNLVADDTNGVWDVFVRDQQTGAMTRVSVGPGGIEGNGGSGPAEISADGRFVAFQSQASNLVADDTNGTWDVFVHDRETGMTTRVSVGPGGIEADGLSAAPAISADGRFVAFESVASNLVTGDTNGTRDVFVHDRETGTTTRVSVGPGGTEANDDSFSPAIDADGQSVAFQSNASNLVTGDTNNLPDVFVYDRNTQTTSRVSVATGGAQGDLHSWNAAISADGRSVAFQSEATNLVTDDTNGTRDVFVHDRQTGTTTRVSVATSGTESNGTSQSPAFGASSRLVAFASNASNLVTVDTNGVYDVFVRDRGDAGCAATLAPTSVTAPAAGTTGSVQVLVEAGCAWTAESNDPAWLTVTGGATGTGAGTVTYDVAASAGAPRTGTVTIAGQIFSVDQGTTQPTLALGPSSLHYAAINAGGALTTQTDGQTVTLTQSDGAGVTWAATSSDPWIEVSPTSGTGNATFTVTIVDTGSLPATGTLNGTVTVSAPGAANAPTLDVSLALLAPGSTTRPLGTLDWLYGDATVSGSIVIGGWVVDDVGVSRVEVYRDRMPGEPLQGVLPPNHPGYDKIYIATAEVARTLPFGPDTALFIDGARPDIEALFPAYPWNYRAGWGYLMLTWGLPNLGTGTYTLYAYAFDRDGTYPTDYTLLGSRTFSSDNSPTAAPKPFGAIDAPFPGETVSGVKLSGGWALTQPSTCHVANVWVGIDSAPLEPAVYGDLIPGFDVYFPSADYVDSPYAGIAYFLDSTLLTNGLHQLGYLVQDSCGHEDGIGSRFFSVLNGSSVVAAPDAAGVTDPPAAAMAAPAQSSPPATPLAVVLPDDAVTLTRGYAEVSWAPWQGPEVVARNESGGRVVNVEPLERIAVRLARPGPEVGGVWSGYQLVGTARRALPAGSSLDAREGVFYWQPGPGFFGSYDLVFARTGAAGPTVETPVRIDVGGDAPAPAAAPTFITPAPPVPRPAGPAPAILSLTPAGLPPNRLAEASRPAGQAPTAPAPPTADPAPVDPATAPVAPPPVDRSTEAAARAPAADQTGAATPAPEALPTPVVAVAVPDRGGPSRLSVDAGPDQTVEASAGWATVTLSASAEVIDDATYRWSGTFGTLEGREIDVTLPLGKHTIEVTADTGAETTRDTLVVIVADSTPPRIEPRITPAPDANGVLPGPATVSWVVTDPESFVVRFEGCEDRRVTETTTLRCTATNGAERTATETITLTVRPGWR